MICPSCSANVPDGDWLCPFCEHILDPSVLGLEEKGEGEQASSIREERTRLIAWTPREEDAPAEAMILGDVDVAEQEFSVVQGPAALRDGRTSTFLFYTSNATSRVIHPDAVPELAQKNALLPRTPYEDFLLACIDGTRSVRNIQRVSGLAPQEVTITLLTLLDKGIIRVRPPPPEAAAEPPKPGPAKTPAEDAAPPTLQGSAVPDPDELEDLPSVTDFKEIGEEEEPSALVRPLTTMELSSAELDETGEVEAELPPRAADPPPSTRRFEPEEEDPRPPVAPSPLDESDSEMITDHSLAADELRRPAVEELRTEDPAPPALPRAKKRVFRRGSERAQEPPPLAPPEERPTPPPPDRGDWSEGPGRVPLLAPSLALPEVRDQRREPPAVPRLPRPTGERSREPTPPRVRPAATPDPSLLHTESEGTARPPPKLLPRPTAESRLTAQPPRMLSQGRLPPPPPPKDLPDLMDGQGFEEPPPPAPVEDKTPPPRRAPAPTPAPRTPPAPAGATPAPILDPAFLMEVPPSAIVPAAPVPKVEPERSVSGSIGADEAKRALQQAKRTPVQERDRRKEEVERPKRPSKADAEAPEPPKAPAPKPKADERPRVEVKPKEVEPKKEAEPKKEEPKDKDRKLPAVDSQRMLKAQKLFDQALKDKAEGNVLSARMNMKLALTFDPTNELYQQAFDDLQKLAAADPAKNNTFPKSRARELYEQATKKEEAGQVDEAIELLEKALAESKDAAFYNRLGVILAMKKREFGRAQKLIETALELAPGNSAYQHNLGKVLSMAAAYGDRARKEDKKGGLLGFLGKKR